MRTAMPMAQHLLEEEHFIWSQRTSTGISKQTPQKQDEPQVAEEAPKGAQGAVARRAVLQHTT